jgi:hypothetical protein
MEFVFTFDVLLNEWIVLREIVLTPVLPDERIPAPTINAEPVELPTMLRIVLPVALTFAVEI